MGRLGRSVRDVGSERGERAVRFGGTCIGWEFGRQVGEEGVVSKARGEGECGECLFGGDRGDRLDQPTDGFCMDLEGLLDG